MTDPYLQVKDDRGEQQVVLGPSMVCRIGRSTHNDVVLTDTIASREHAMIRRDAGGAAWMDPPDDAAWIRRLQTALRGRDQVRLIAAGHLRRGFLTTVAGIPMAASPAAATQLTLNLSPIHKAYPDGREILVDEPPGYRLHMWKNGELVSHTGIAGAFPAVAHYAQPLAGESA